MGLDTVNMKTPLITQLKDRVVGQLKQRLTQMDYTRVLALAYVMIAVSLAVTAPRGSIAFMIDTYRAPLDVLIAAFAIAAIILSASPSLRMFVLAHLPIVLYSIAAISYTFAQNIRGEAFTVYYCLMLIAFPLSVRLESTSRLRIHHVYAALLLLIGLSILSYPARGTVAYIQSTYGLTAAAIGGSLVVAAVYLAVSATPEALKQVCIVLLLFIGSAVVFAWTSRNYTASLINLTLAISLLATILKAHTYFPASSVLLSSATLDLSSSLEESAATDGV